MIKNICIIPARMASSRFPGKPLKPLLGLPLVMHVHERCRLCSDVRRVVIATCDEDIRKICEKQGAEVVMTADTHPGCVDRTDEAVAKTASDLADDDLVLMVQGDEVMVNPDMMDAIIDAYASGRHPVVNLASRLYRPEDPDDPNCVKVIGAPDGRALYFSRAPIPSRVRAESPERVPMYQQTGIIGFAKAFVHRFGTLPRTALETVECIDMLRVLEHGLRVQLVWTEQETIGVDTAADLARAERMLRDDPLTRRYLDIPA